VGAGQTGLVESMREVIVAVRNIRAEMNVPAKTEVLAIIHRAEPALEAFLKRREALVREEAGVSGLEFSDRRPAKSSLAVVAGCEVLVPLEGIVDFDREAERVREEVEDLRRLVRGIDEKFANPDFAARARPEIVEAERQRRGEFAAKLERLERQLASWR
jgi:valyl-tRNA synthetase